ncbi:hypothetical protein LTR33_002492 [Friedmanniomyces endolithicus]|nr:hypothetical protein LTR33_002492 [Friedmanniomyces endolithicus]
MTPWRYHLWTTVKNLHTSILPTRRPPSIRIRKDLSYTSLTFLALGGLTLLLITFPTTTGPQLAAVTAATRHQNPSSSKYAKSKYPPRNGKLPKYNPIVPKTEQIIMGCHVVISEHTIKTSLRMSAV